MAPPRLDHPLDQAVPLTSARCRGAVRIAGYAEPAHAQRLRELGLIEGCLVRIVAGADPLICAVGAARIALARHLAESILVRKAHAAVP